MPALSLMLVEPAASAALESMRVLRDLPVPDDAAVMVGPEGGWTEAEWSAARARGVRLVTMGARTLRADAVPVAAISILQFVWDQC
jgi:16S rRNA (uracil1498-N3)-methyltransferase